MNQSPKGCAFLRIKHQRLRAYSAGINLLWEMVMELNGRSMDGDVWLVELREDALDAARVRAFKDTFTSVVGTRKKVVLDLEGVRFVDSSGMGALISCLRLLDGRGGDLRLASVSKPVRALLELMRMHRVFSIHDTPAEAAKAFT